MVCARRAWSEGKSDEGNPFIICKESSMCYSWWKAVRVVLNQAGSEAGLCVIAMVVQCIHG